MPDYSKLVPAPTPESINSYAHPARVSTMSELLGMPKSLTENCHNEHATDKVKHLLVTKDVGPFSVTGITPFVELLERVFNRVKEHDMELYNALGNAGVLCVRLVRHSKTLPSNHCWGMAIDMTMKDPNSDKFILDPQGNGKVQLGCLRLYEFFKLESQESGEWCFWGAGFQREDGMHFEASDELMRMWKCRGKI